MSYRGHARFGVFLLAIGLFATAGAETVHTWVDAQGVRHFSQYPPADPDQTAETLELEPLPAGPDAGDRLQDIRDIGRDLERSRQQREEQRARQAPPPAPAPAPEPPVVAPTYVLPYPPAYPPPYPPPYPPHRQKPHPRDPGGADEPDDDRNAPKGRFVSPGRAAP